jgi:xanthine dehydrogenase YagS FAD-binding subunit
MQPFAYARPDTLPEALALLGKQWGEVEVLAGGSDLLGLLKDYVVTPQRVVDLKGVRELGGIRKTSSGLRIGALVTFDDLAENAAVRADYPALTAAARGVASPQIRNVGTVAGDLCQRPRCWYFRLGYGLLARGKDGKSLVQDGDNRYHAILGNQGPAKFVSASSLGPALIALGAQLRLASSGSSRLIPAEKFFVTPENESQRETALQPGEIVSEILLPPARGIRSATYEVRQKESLDWPLAAAAVAVQKKGETVARARIVLGHVAPIPWVATQAERALAGRPITPESIEVAAQSAVAEATPLSGNEYKVQLTKVAVKRALLAL